MNRINYDKIMAETIAAIGDDTRPRLCLHACCAPCSSHTLTVLAEYFDITLYFFNPNIAPEEEYRFRCGELKRLVKEMELDVKIIEEEYDPAPFYEITKGLEDQPERGERCRKCISLRLEAAGAKAKEIGCDYFTTTLTISPHKDCDYINQRGLEIADECGVPYLCSDFKKHDGYKHSIALSRQYNLYRQNYCGCRFSARQAKESDENG